MYMTLITSNTAACSSHVSDPMAMAGASPSVASVASVASRSRTSRRAADARSSSSKDVSEGKAVWFTPTHARSDCTRLVVLSRPPSPLSTLSASSTNPNPMSAAIFFFVEN